jgi:hypothetical protein
MSFGREGLGMEKSRASRSLLVDAEYAELIGDICILWNLLEGALNSAFPRYFEYGQKKSAAISSVLGNQSRVDLLSYLVENFEKTPEIAKRMKYLIAAFSVCRENRNIIVHGAVEFNAPLDIKFLHKPSRSKVGATVKYAYDLTAIKKVHAGVYQTLLFANALLLTIYVNEIQDRSENPDHAGEPLALPEIPHLPSKLTPLPPEVPPA